MRIDIGDALTITDLRLIRDAFWATTQVGAPYLPAERWFKRAKKLADRGLLLASPINLFPPVPDAAAYFVTRSGVDAYNAAMKGQS